MVHDPAEMRCTKANLEQARLVTDDDIGLKVLREAPAGAQIIEYIYSCSSWSLESILSYPSIVAIHGIGAHPDDSWCKNIGTAENQRWVNWLEEESMLPAVAPGARIMRYGYQSQWYGKEAIRQKTSTVAKRLLLALQRRREVQTLCIQKILPLTVLGAPSSAANVHSTLLRWPGCA